jgi:hypothetical protein
VAELVKVNPVVVMDPGKLEDAAGVIVDGLQGGLEAVVTPSEDSPERLEPGFVAEDREGIFVHKKYVLDRMKLEKIGWKGRGVGKVSILRL